MTNFVLNPDFKSKTIDELFSHFLEFCEKKEQYKTISGNKTHCVLEVSSDFILIKRLDAENKPKLTFDEIRKVLSYFKEGLVLTMQSDVYVSSLTSVVHKTPLMSLLKASDVIMEC